MICVIGDAIISQFLSNPSMKIPKNTQLQRSITSYSYGAYNLLKISAPLVPRNNYSDDNAAPLRFVLGDSRTSKCNFKLFRLSSVTNQGIFTSHFGHWLKRHKIPVFRSRSGLDWIHLHGEISDSICKCMHIP